MISAHEIWSRGTLLAACLVGIFALSLNVSPVQGGQNGELTEQHVDRLWQMHWREIALRYVSFGDDYVCFADYNPRHKNSRGLSSAEYKRDNKYELKSKDSRGKEVVQKLDKPQEEVDAATEMLQAFEVGQYGYILSGKVDEIVDAKTVQLTDVELIDAETTREIKREALKNAGEDTWRSVEDALRRGAANRGWGRGGRGRGVPGSISGKHFATREAIDWGFEEREKLIDAQEKVRFVKLIIYGFDASRMSENKRWPSENSRQKPQIAIVKRESSGFGGRNTTFHAIPATKLRGGLSQEQTLEMLQSRGHTKETFAEMILDAKREHGRDYLPAIITALEGEAEVRPAEEAVQLEDEIRVVD